MSLRALFGAAILLLTGSGIATAGGHAPTAPAGSTVPGANA